MKERSVAARGARFVALTLVVAAMLAVLPNAAPALSATRVRAPGSPARALRTVSAPALFSSHDIPGQSKTLPFMDETTMTACDDVYAVQLNAGDRLVVSLFGSNLRSSMSLFLYDPAATSVDDTPSIVDSSLMWGSNVSSISYVASVSGTYFVDAYAPSAQGVYAMLAWIKPPDADSEPSGATTEALSFTVQDSLAATSDMDDVYRIHLAKGQICSAAMLGAPGTNFALSLFPGTVAGHPLRDVDDPGAAVAWSDSVGSSSESLKWAADQAGDYYLDVAQGPTFLGYSGLDGTYTVNVGVVPKAHTSLSIHCSAQRVGRGRAITLKGVLSGGTSGDRCAVDVRLPHQAKWTTLSKVTCRTGGAWSCSYTPHKKGTYQFRVSFAGGAYRKASISRTVTLKAV